MRKLTFVILLILACSVTVLLAQGPSPAGPPDSAQRVQQHVKFMTALLTLNAAQQQQATTIFTSVEKGKATLHDQMKSAHDSLNSAVKNNDTAAIDQASSTIGSLIAQMTASDAKARAAFYQILTPEQQDKLNQLQGPGLGGPGDRFFMGFETFAPGPGPR